MNKRIRELVILAKLDDPNFPIEDWDNVPLAKFAQLIIDECMTLCNCEDAQDLMDHFRDKDKI